MNKGEKGYISGQKKRSVIITVFMFALAAGIYLLGLLTLNTNKSLWTVIAVLSLLPASKNAVRLIMLLRVRNTSEAFYRETEACGKGLFILYDLIFTTYENIFVVRALCCAGNSVCLFSETGEPEKLKAYLNKALTGRDRLTVMVCSDKQAFFKRLSEMSRHFSSTPGEDGPLTDGRAQAEPECFETIRALVL